MITSVPNWEALTPQEILEYLSTTEDIPDSQVVIVATLMDAVGIDNARTVLGTLKAAAEVDPIIASAYQALNTVGITLHSPERQGLIDAIAANAEWPAELTAAVKGLGVKSRPRYVGLGYDDPPTLQSVETELVALADAAARDLITETLYGSQWNTHIAPILDGNASTATVDNLVSGLRALADAIEGV